MIKLLFRIKNSLKSRLYFDLEMKYIKLLFCYCGKETVISQGCIIAGHKNIYIGEKTYIGPECLMYSTNAKLSIGNNVTLGPRVSIVTGDHRFDVIGNYINENIEKLPENDQDVKIEDDCWIGMNVNILKGVTIGHGSVVAAGVTVVKDIPPYSIYISKDKILQRFSNEQLIIHEEMLKKKEKNGNKLSK